jgi:23S rRNA (cytidine1920-2'-O)/16S rRNA (cytidine1409-2'-O)-methyltransferase
MARMRADLLLVARGLAESRAKAQAAIAAGGVRANAVLVRKASDLIDEDAALEAAPAHPWVSRGGVKLAHALEVFGVDPAERTCLDVGASTGGFTQVLRARGAAKVYAVDVGSAQLHVSLRADPRVINLERMDARALTRAEVPDAPSLIVCDASFIGAAKVLSAPLALAASDADLIVLIKPQFEAGPGQGGVLREEIARTTAKTAIASLDGVEGFRFVADTDSPIRGGDGNLELLAYFKRRCFGERSFGSGARFCLQRRVGCAMFVSIESNFLARYEFHDDAAR